MLMIQSESRVISPELAGKRRANINWRAQSSLEYALVIICLVAALLAMRVYVTRSMQGNYKRIADDISPKQYDPGNTTGFDALIYSTQSGTVYETRNEAQLGVDLDGDGVLEDDVFGTKISTELGNETTQRYGYEEIQVNQTETK